MSRTGGTSSAGRQASVEPRGAARGGTPSSKAGEGR
jgi:hypothetical protein